jgi:hypothetical protein
MPALPPKKFADVFRRTRVLRFPRHSLATFGSSEITYNLVTPVSTHPPESRLRTGLVTASRPKILTPGMLAERFQGFGDSREFEGALQDVYREAFRALEYNFHNRLDAVSSRSMAARPLAESIRRDLDAAETGRAAVIQGSESGWQFSLMKFIVEETLRSFHANVQELDERGLFDPAQAALSRRRGEIESLFQAARRDPGRLRDLWEKLKSCGLFDEYQDRFFDLSRRP